MIRHIVALRFREGVSYATKAGLFADLAALANHIEGIVAFRSFVNVSVETHLVRGFNDLFWFDFRDAAVRDAYLVDAAHQALGARIVAQTLDGPEGVFVLDVQL